MAAIERRQTPTERLHEVTMAALARPRADAEHGCEITRNAKGVAQFTVTRRGPDFEEVIASAEAAFDRLCAKYPYPAVNGDGE